jgi:D-arabinose 1-dehydrogenase-like Zn-dependent alcohol dehydrogenase
MAKMKAAVVRQFGKPLVIEDVPVPVPGPGEILVKVMACGVCHTDLHAAEGDWPVKPSTPFIPGHEVAGVVAALGPGVTDFKPGDPVGVAWLHDACMRCEYCETGWETVCEHQHNTGYSCDGGFAEYVIAAAPFAARLPVGVDFAQIAPILCAGVTTYKGLKETEARPGNGSRSPASVASDMSPSNTPRRWGCTLRRLILLRTNLRLPGLPARTSRLMRAHRMRWPIFSRRPAAVPTASW